MDLEKKLFELEDLEYKKFNSKLAMTKYEVIGVRIPLLRKIAKELATSNELYTSNNKYYESVLVEGLIIHYSNINSIEYFKRMDKYIHKIDSWAICDTVISKKKELLKDLDLVWKKAVEYININEEFTIRAGIILMMTYFVTEEYLPKIFIVLNKIKNDKYYVKMGIAWLLAECYKKHTRLTHEFLKNNNLDNWTQNKAIQKIKESLPISKEDKEKAIKLKRV